MRVSNFTAENGEKRKIASVTDSEKARIESEKVDFFPSPEAEIDIRKPSAIKNEIDSKIVTPGRKNTILPGGEQVPVNKAKHYRRGTIVLQRVIDKKTVDADIVRKLQELKARGAVHRRSLMGLTIFAAGGSNAFDDPFSVSNYPITVQASFRRKMYTLLLLETLYSASISYLIFFVPSLNILVNESITIIALTIVSFVLILSLLGLYLVKYETPYNYIAFAIFSTLKGVVCGLWAAKYSFEVLILLATVSLNSFLLNFFSSIVFDYGTTNARMISIKVASIFTWIVYVITISLVLCLTHYFETNQGGMLARNLFLMTLLTIWFAFDGQSMMHKMAVDEYMQAIIFYYTDLLLLLLLLAIIALSMMGEGGGGMQLDCCIFGDVGNVNTPGNNNNNNNREPPNLEGINRVAPHIEPTATPV